MSTTDHAAALDETHTIELSIGGMTCASCAVRIEKKLNKLEGVSATDNFATEKAKVTFADEVAREEPAGDGESEAQALRLAGAVEYASGHPIAQAIAAHAATVASLPGVENFENHGGQGVSGVVVGHAIVAGRYRWLREQWALSATESLQLVVDEAETAGRTPVWTAWDGGFAR